MLRKWEELAWCISYKSRCKNAQIKMEILGKIILIHFIDIKDFRPYTKKTHHYKI